VAFTLGESTSGGEELGASGLSKEVETEINEGPALVHHTSRNIDIHQHTSDSGSDRLEVASPEDHTSSNVLGLAVCEEAADIEGILQRRFHSHDDIERGYCGENGIIVTLFTFEESMKDFQIDFRYFCEADLVRLRPGCCFWLRWDAIKIYFKLVLCGMAGGENENTRGKKIFAAIIDATRRKDLGVYFGL
jgi:hypothetical protein